MERRVFSAFFVLLAGVMIGCHKDTNKPANKFEAVGTRYTYSVNDSLANKTYSVVVNIVSRRLILGKYMNVWIYHYPAGLDTNYVLSSPDSIAIYDHHKALSRVYFLAFSIGQKWRNVYVFDSCKVLSQGSVTSGGSIYSKAYQIREHASSFNYQLHRTEWFLPGTGMIKMNESIYDLGPAMYQSWELVKVE